MMLAVGAMAAGARSQRPRPPSACEQSCDTTEQAERARCHDEPCRARADFSARRCALRCNTTMSEVDRCRAECDIQSAECDHGCRSQRDERGCLRRCGSHYHISCPQDCTRDPTHGLPTD